MELPGASDHLRKLAERGVRQVYGRRRRLIEEGDHGQTLYIVLSGRLRVFSTDPGTGRVLLIGHYGPGEYVGEMSLDGGRRSASVEAAERTECAIVARPTLDAFLAEFPAFTYELLAKVIGRARAATLTARQLALNDVYGRLRHHLETETQVQTDGLRALVPRPSRRALAEVLGCSAGMVTKLINDLKAGEFLIEEPDRMVVLRTLPVRW